MHRFIIVLMILLMGALLPVSMAHTSDSTSEPAAEPTYVLSGYTANITSRQIADTVYVYINAYHSTDAIYNSCEIELSYNAEILHFNMERSMIGFGAYRDTNGQLLFLDFGADKPLGESVYVLAFDVIGRGEAEIQLCRAAFSTSEKAISQDVEPIVNEPNGVTMWVK